MINEEGKKSEAWVIAAVLGWLLLASIYLATKDKMEANTKVRQVKEKLKLKREAQLVQAETTKALSTCLWESDERIKV